MFRGVMKMEYFIYYQDITAKLEEQGEERIQQIKENELYELKYN